MNFCFPELGWWKLVSWTGLGAKLPEHIHCKIHAARRISLLLKNSLDEISMAGLANHFRARGCYVCFTIS
jgi:hypothetical protein